MCIHCNYGLLGVPYTWRPFCFATVSLLFLLLYYFFRILPKDLRDRWDRFTKLSGKTYGGLGLNEFYFRYSNFCRVGSWNLRSACFLDLVDLLMLTGFNMGGLDPHPRDYLFNCTHLPDDLRSDRKHPSKKSADWKWMTSVDQKWVKCLLGYL